LIYQRKEEDVLAHIEEICKALEVIEYYEFLGAELETDETKMTKFSTVNVEESRLNEVTIRFRVTHKDEEQIVEKKFFVPKLVDNFFFVINDVRYFPVYQIVDREVFVTPQVYSLKTLLMPIRFKYKKMALTSRAEEEVSFYDFKLQLFKNIIPFAYYFLAEKGVPGTVEYFGLTYGDLEDGCDLSLVVATEDEVAEHEEEYHAFLLTEDYSEDGHGWLMVRKEVMAKPDKASFVGSVFQAMWESGCFEDGDEEWKEVLGAIFTKSANAYRDKAENVLFSLRRILDDRTRRVLDKVAPEDKEDIYGILRWMITTFEQNRYQDNMDLKYKRIQCWEYLLQPLLQFFSHGTYRIINSKNLGMKQLTGIFNVGPNFIIKRLQANELVRYSGCVNVIDLFGAALKVTFRGPGSIAEKSDVPDRYRGVHPSYIGRVSVVTTSSGDPGLTTVLTPFCETEKGLFKPREFAGDDYE
jgi:hypothetical protein